MNNKIFILNSILHSTYFHIISSMFSFFFLQTAYGQTEKNITLNYCEKDFIYKYNNEGLLTINTIKYPSVFQEDTLAPALPYICVNVLIGKDQEFDSLSIVESSHIVLEDVEMAQNPKPLPTNIPLLNKIDRVNFSLQIYPSKKVEYIGTHLMDGYKFLTFSVCPFTYISTDRKLSLSDNVELKIRCKPRKSDVRYN